MRVLLDLKKIRIRAPLTPRQIHAHFKRIHEEKFSRTVANQIARFSKFQYHIIFHLKILSASLINRKESKSSKILNNKIRKLLAIKPKSNKIPNYIWTFIVAINLPIKSNCKTFLFEHLFIFFHHVRYIICMVHVFLKRDRSYADPLHMLAVQVDC